MSIVLKLQNPLLTKIRCNYTENAGPKKRVWVVRGKVSGGGVGWVGQRLDPYLVHCEVDSYHQKEQRNAASMKNVSRRQEKPAREASSVAVPREGTRQAGGRWSEERAGATI